MQLTLLPDGSSDRALLPLLRWLLRERSTAPFELTWADLRRLRQPPSKLADRVRVTLDLHPCHILVVHRDAERDPPEKRLEEIARATTGVPVPIVCAVPVRMTEAWLFVDEHAIRHAAGCPNGTMPLGLPPLRDVESLSDPKDLLFSTLRTASNLSGRRLKKFDPDRFRLASLIEDFSPLRVLPSFRALEASLQSALLTLGVARD
ncbi:MAG: hypothetical protein R3F14_20430 [Polyangiaceae bacterium]